MRHEYERRKEYNRYMEQIPLNFQPDSRNEESSLSQLELEIQKIMQTEGPAYKGNREAAEQLAEIRLRKKNKDTVQPYPPLHN